MTDIDTWKKELRAVAREDKIKILSSFFKTGKGEYGEGDVFIGITVPDNRSVSRRYHSIPLNQIETMLMEPVHEFRLAGLLALVEAYKRAKNDPVRCREIAEFYLANARCCNNWDLVDLSSQYILGEYMILTGNDNTAWQLAQSDNMWERRIAIVSMLAFVRKSLLDTPMALAGALLHSEESLLQKATGWVLREVGKRDKPRLCRFLDTHAATMPRTTLRYAIERFPADERKRYMSLYKK